MVTSTFLNLKTFIHLSILRVIMYEDEVSLLLCSCTCTDTSKLLSVIFDLLLRGISFSPAGPCWAFLSLDTKTIRHCNQHSSVISDLSEVKRPSFKTFTNQYLFNMSACLPSIYDFICIIFYWIVYEKTVLQWWDERDRQWCGSWTDLSLSLIPLSMRSVPGQHTRLRVVVCVRV